MSDILCITNRRLCRESFLLRIEKIAAARPAAIILREKDLTEQEYTELAREVLQICRKYRTPCILHTFVKAAKELRCSSLHLPLPLLRSLSEEDKACFTTLGASCHSVKDAVEAEKLGCTYITAGHVYDTDCKKGLPGRGLTFLHDVCRHVSILVYAIGGIDASNIAQIRENGAAGACIMSSIMSCEAPSEYLQKL